MALTKNDKTFIEKVFNIKTLSSVTKVVLEELIEEKGLVTKKDLKYLPSKEEFYREEDKLMGELKAMREEHQMLSGRVYQDHEPRLEKLEKIHPQGKHPAVI